MKTSMRLKKNVSLISHVMQLPYFYTVLSSCFALFILLSLFSYNPHDQSWFYYSTDVLPPTNYCGTLGAYFSALCFYVWGGGSYLLVLLSVYGVVCLAKKKKWYEEIERVLAFTTLLFTVPGLLFLYEVGTTSYIIAGGYAGQEIFKILSVWFDGVGAIIFLHVALAVQLILISRLSFIRFFLFIKYAGSYFMGSSWLIFNLLSGLSFILLRGKKFLNVIFRFLVVATSWVSQTVFADFKSKELEKNPFDDDYHEASVPRAQDVTEQQTFSSGQQSVGGVKNRSESHKSSSFELPSITLFAQPKKEDILAKDESKQTAVVLEEKLEKLGVVGSVVAIKKGPVVTLFEYQPAIETKLSKIMALESDLALALEAMSVRIMAPIPGTSRVGFEVSNKERRSVLFGESIRSQAYQQSTARLPLILGQDTVGNQAVVDLADMPHVLVAGSTGSGKSVALNAMLVSLLCRLTPDQLRIVIIDPKRLEFAAYHDIPHLLFPIITDSHRAVPVLKWLIATMEQRYEMMAEQGLRNIYEYKKACKEKGLYDELPYIVLIIDELAELMMIAGKECEEGIARLAQMARAAGIHLIVATQRPSVDVVTGVIKVNFPSRISFRLTTKIDSRTILDAPGAEGLLGKGDMLFMDSASARIRRVHGAYVSDAEIKKVADAWRVQQKVEYKDLQEVLSAYHTAQQEEAHDTLLPQALEFLQTVDRVSISLLQRRFSIGYNRSARLMELLEMQGKVMPADGSKLRKVIR